MIKELVAVFLQCTKLFPWIHGSLRNQNETLAKFKEPSVCEQLIKAHRSLRASMLNQKRKTVA